MNQGTGSFKFETRNLKQIPNTTDRNFKPSGQIWEIGILIIGIYLGFRISCLGFLPFRYSKINYKHPLIYALEPNAPPVFHNDVRPDYPFRHPLATLGFPFTHYVERPATKLSNVLKGFSSKWGEHMAVCSFVEIRHHTRAIAFANHL